MDSLEFEHLYETTQDTSHRFVTNHIWGFLQGRMVNSRTRKNCKGCNQIIYDQFHIQSFESRRPLYHVICYNTLHAICISKLESVKDTLLNGLSSEQIAELSKTVPL